MFINENLLTSLLNKKPSYEEIKGVLERAERLEDLSLEETAVLTSSREEMLELLTQTAAHVKEKVWGRVVNTYDACYPSNICNCICTYCGDRADNRFVTRRRLTPQELTLEIQAILHKGHRNICILYGEDPRITPEDYTSDLNTAAQTESLGQRSNHLSFNICPRTPEWYRELRRTMKVEDIQVRFFQETYHPEAYQKYHIRGMKANYEDRLYGIHRIIEGGFPDTGLGVLLGLYDWRFEVVALVAHAREIYKQFGIYPRSISTPVVRPAHGIPWEPTMMYPYFPSDLQRIQTIAILKIALPFCDQIITDRESPEFLQQVTPFVTRRSAQVRTGPGDNQEAEAGCVKAVRSHLIPQDYRTFQEVVSEIREMGFIPSRAHEVSPGNPHEFLNKARSGATCHRG